MKLTFLLAWATLISLPLYVLRCKSLAWCESPIPLSFLEILILATFGGWILWRISSIRKGKITSQRLYDRLTGPLFLPIALFLFFSTIAIFVSPDFRAAAGIWKAYFIEPFLLYLVVLDLSLEKKSPFWVIPPLIISGVLVALYGVSQFFTRVDPFSPGAITQGRITSVFDNPNALGMYLSPMVILALIFLFQLLKVRSKQFLTVSFTLTSLVIFALAIYLTKSRGAILGSIISTILMLASIFYLNLPTFYKKLTKTIFFISVAAYFLVSLVVFMNVEGLAAANKDSPPTSVSARFCIWESTKKMLSDKPLLGTGLSGFPKVYPDYKTCEEFVFQYPHNIILNFWTEIGVLGLASFLYLIYKYLNILDFSNSNFFSFGLLAIVVYTFLHGAVDAPYFKNDLSAQFWVILAMGAWWERARSEKLTTDLDN